MRKTRVRSAEEILKNINLMKKGFYISEEFAIFSEFLSQIENKHIKIDEFTEKFQEMYNPNVSEDKFMKIFRYLIYYWSHVNRPSIVKLPLKENGNLILDLQNEELSFEKYTLEVEVIENIILNRLKRLKINDEEIQREYKLGDNSKIDILVNLKPNLVLIIEAKKPGLLDMAKKQIDHYAIEYYKNHLWDEAEQETQEDNPDQYIFSDEMQIKIHEKILTRMRFFRILKWSTDGYENNFQISRNPRTIDTKYPKVRTIQAFRQKVGDIINKKFRSCWFELSGGDFCSIVKNRKIDAEYSF